MCAGSISPVQGSVKDQRMLTGVTGGEVSTIRHRPT